MRYLQNFGILAIVLIALLAQSNCLPNLVHWGNHVPMADKVGHFSLFGLLCLLMMARFKNKSFVHYIPVVVVLLAMLDEAVQYFLPYRVFNVLDFIAGVLGIATAAACFSLFNQGLSIRKKITKKIY